MQTECGADLFGFANAAATARPLTRDIKAADAKLDDYLQRLDKSDATESGKDGSRVKGTGSETPA